MTHTPFHAHDAPAHPYPVHHPSHMQGFAKALLLGVAIVITIAGVLFYALSRPTTSNDYDDCVNAPGSIVQESYPATCITKDGKSFIQPTPDNTQSSPSTGSLTEVVVTEPVSGAFVANSFIVRGTVPPGWMFEGVFPVELQNAKGIAIAQATGTELEPGSWSSGSPIAFTATVEFPATTGKGTLVLKKDNPSGLPENDRSFKLPVAFSREGEGQVNAKAFICRDNGGQWLAKYNECEYISQDQCETNGGTYNACESACRHDQSSNSACIKVCVGVCSF